MFEDHLLIRHAHVWAARKGRPMRRELLGQVLEIRSVMDDAAHNWPAGSSELLLPRN